MILKGLRGTLSTEAAIMPRGVSLPMADNGKKISLVRLYLRVTAMPNFCHIFVIVSGISTARREIDPEAG